MFRNFVAAIAIAASLFACAGPQAFAQPGPVPSTSISVPLATSTTPIATAEPVLVQPSGAPIVNSDGTFNFNPLLDGLIKLAGAALVVVATWVLGQATPHLNKWLGTHIEAKEAAKDLNLAAYANTAAVEVINFAKQRTGFKDEDLKNVEFRNPFLQTAAALLFKMDPGVWRWVSNQEGTVMQWLESKLPPEAALEKKAVDGKVVPADVAAAAAANPAPKAAT